MNEKMLETYKTVVETGSFSKAAEILYSTHTSVLKQINSLEYELGTKLLCRTNRGIKLTAAGKQFYIDAAKILEEFSGAILRAKNAEHAEESMTIRVGFSIMYPARLYEPVWNRVSHIYPNINLKIVMFDDKSGNLLGLGKDYDFLVGPLGDGEYSEGFGLCNVGTCNVCVGISSKSVLARKEEICLSELSGMRIKAPPRNSCEPIDHVRDLIENDYKAIKLTETSPYIGVDTFNDIAAEKYAVITLDWWRDVHPAVNVIPLREGGKCPYGLIYAKDHDEQTEKMLKIIKEIYA